MNIQLPNRIDGSKPIELKGVRQVTIIGANGSGKTRFTQWLVDNNADKAFRVSALKAMFPKAEKNPLKGSIDTLYDELSSTSLYLRNDAATEFDRLIYLLLHDEFLDLLKFKAESMLGEKGCGCPKTKLDKVVKMWQEVFPKNKILRDSGKLLFSNDVGDKPYSSIRLSDGEKAVLYYIGAVLYAPVGSMVFVEDPEIFIHHSIMQALWNVIEEMRPDCTFIYNTHDIEFASSRLDNKCIWVRNYDALKRAWDYETVNPGENLSDELYFDLLGSRKPILFVEGDSSHSIDSKLYALIFSDYTVKPLGSCNKVIETTRSFNDMKDFHHLDSHGIVDRDRRDTKEVQYLRDRKIFVPNVAEIENIMMLEGVIRAVARHHKKDDDRVFMKVRSAVINMFKSDLRKQALEHVRHRVKRTVEVRIDKRFQDISELEEHMTDLVNEINPRGIYEDLCRSFHTYANNGDYSSILRVYNEKTMLPNSNVAQLCGFECKEEYIKDVLAILKEGGKDADAIRTAIKSAFGLETTEADIS